MNISDVRIISNEMMIAANVIPLARKHHAVPIAPTSTAASAGPKMRDPVITAVLSDVAFGISAGSTSSVTSARRAGLSNALTSAEHERQHEDHRHVDRAGQIEQAQHDRLRPPAPTG